MSKSLTICLLALVANLLIILCVVANQNYENATNYAKFDYIYYKVNQPINISDDDEGDEGINQYGYDWDVFDHDEPNIFGKIYALTQKQSIP